MRFGRALVGACCALLAAAPAASAHAVLESSQPERGAALERAPGGVSFTFNEPVEGSFGAVRVFDARGERVDDDRVTRPGDGSESIGVGLDPGLGDGSYTATYRVVSADGHPVTGGFVFSVGEGGASPGATVDELIDAGRAGPVTEIGFGVVRGLAYAAIALAVGGVAFLLAAWLPGLGAVAGSGGRWREASEAFSRRLRATLAFAVATGAVTSALGVALQGATAGGTSLWAALDPDVISEVLDTRFGTVWGLRGLAWLLAGAALAIALSPRARTAMRPAVGADGLAPAGAPRPAALALLAVPLGFVALSPALAGHASTQDPEALLVPVNLIHVLAMSAWLGGLALLLAAVPAATRRLEPPERTRLLAAVLRRFSPLALAAVAALLVTGLVQAYVHVRSVDNLTETAFGRAVLIKFALVAVALLALGAYQRYRSVPRLRALERGGAPPGRGGLLLRRALRAEVALITVVLGVTAALVSYAPSVAEQSGPFSTATDMGPLRLDLTVDPARAGRNEIHVYLTDAADGTQFEGTRELRVALRLPDKDIGPIDTAPRRAGPGHYVVTRADLGVAGDWELAVSARVSEFDQYDASVEVPVE